MKEENLKVQVEHILPTIKRLIERLKESKVKKCYLPTYEEVIALEYLYKESEFNYFKVNPIVI